MHTVFRFAVPAALFALGACTTVPTGPSTMALPGSNKTFDQFRADDFSCREYASGQIGGTTPSQAATDSTAKSAAVGTVLGAAAGGAMDGGHGAAVGAGIGLLAGAMAGSGSGSGPGVQRRYDNAYTQCMYSYGHKVPVTGQFTSAPSGSPPPGPMSTLPPPPPPR
jgi:hypothetical protein